MRSFFIFSILEQSYGIDVSRVKRILPAQHLTAIPDEDKRIEGMFQYEGQVTKVLSFRMAIGQRLYAQELQELFEELKNQHKEWLSALKFCVENDTKFMHATDSNDCHLGAWLNSFQVETKEMKELVKNLNYHHQRLHAAALDVLKIRESNKQEALQWINDNLEDMYKNTISYLNEITERSTEVAVSFQRCLILNSTGDEFFGVNVDGVEDIIHVNDGKLHIPKQKQELGEFMNLEAILEHNGRLITIVKDINIDKSLAS